ncbi:hypothetical protein, partial [Candidatus Cardinium sp. cBcalN1]
VSHDIFQIISQKEKQNDQTITHKDQLKICRWATIVFGLLAMLIAFRCRDLLILMYWAIDSAVPILVVPFILAIFGFR